MDNIILTGYMGCGKTTVGIKLSYFLKKSFLDTDKIIERQQNMEISRIFAEKGETAFRQMETALLRRMIAEERGKIISTGGGLPVKEENRRLLKELGCVVYLKASPETVYERVKGDMKRPLLQCEEPLSRIRQMIADRETAYRESAHVVVDVDGRDFEAIITEIKEKMDEYFSH